MSRYVPMFVTAFLFIYSGFALTQSVEKEPAAVIELGPAASRSLTEGQSSSGPQSQSRGHTDGNWLEIEAGATLLFRSHSTEWSTDLLLKKPWTLSDKMEFMAGVGPGWIHTNAFGIKKGLSRVEVATDFMFWSSRKHRFGWYLEPSHDYKFGAEHEHSLGISGGLLIGIL